MHALSGVVFGNNPQALTNAPVWLLIVFSPLGLFATWAPIFAVISGIAQAYVLHGVASGKAFGQRLSIRSFFAGTLVTSLFLYLLSLFNMAFMHHSMPFEGAFRHTLLTGSLAQGRFVFFDVKLLFYNDALSMVAVNGLLTSIVLYLLWWGNCLGHPRRAAALLCVAAGAFFLASPGIHGLLDPLYFSSIHNGHYGMAFMLKLIVGTGFSTIPYAGYGLAGSVMGILLAQRVSAAWLRRHGYGASALLIACGILLVAVQGFSPVELASHPYSLKIHVLNLGTMLAACTWLALRLEYCSEARRALLARRTLWLRRFGLLALTLFCLESFTATLFSRAYLALCGIPGPFPQSPFYVLPFVAFVLAFWTLVLYFWQRKNFKYSIEWWISRLAGFARGRPSARLQTEEVLYKPCFSKATQPKPCPTGVK